MASFEPASRENTFGRWCFFLFRDAQRHTLRQQKEDTEGHKITGVDNPTNIAYTEIAPELGLPQGWHCPWQGSSWNCSVFRQLMLFLEEKWEE